MADYRKRLSDMTPEEKAEVAPASDNFKKVFGDRSETPTSVKAAETAVAFTPVGSVLEISEELDKEDPSYGKVAVIAAGDVLGAAIPAAGPVAKTLIKQGSKKIEDVKDLIKDADTDAVENLGLTEESLEAWKKENYAKDKYRQPPQELLEEAAIALREGEITSAEFRELSDGFQPIIPIEEMPVMPTKEEVVQALHATDKRKVSKGIVGVNKEIPDGTPISARLDIPAYNDTDTWIVSLHDGTEKSGKTVGYAQTAVLEDVTFTTNPLAASAIASGKGKTTIARMNGSYVNADPEEVYDIAKALLESDAEDWTQVGMNPYRASYFYDKSDGMPVVSSDQVIQVGPLVLAQNVKKTTPDDEQFEFFNKITGVTRNFYEGGMARGMQEQMEMNFGDVPDNTVGIDPVSGNEIPMGSTAENVRDDIPSYLSEGEIVIPADVVNFHGVKLFEDLRAEAKLGYAAMAEDGRIGGQPVEDTGMPDDLEVQLNMEDLEVTDVAEPIEMKRGGISRLGGGKTLGARRRAAAAKSAAAHKAHMDRVNKNSKSSNDRSFSSIKKRAQAAKSKPKNRFEALKSKFFGDDKKKPTRNTGGSRLDLGFGGNPMERAARKYGPAPEKPAGQVEKAYTGENIRGDNQQALQNLQDAGASAVEGITSGAKAAGKFLTSFFDEGGLADGTFAQEGGFDLSSVEEGMGTQPVLEMREYMNDAGHRIYITFINGEPQMAIPEGYYPVGSSQQMSMEEVEQASSGGGDGGGSDMPEPVPFNYDELSIDELREEVTNVVKPSIGIIDKIGKSIHSSKLIKEIDRRLENTELPIYEKEYLENLKKVAQNPQPSLLEKGLSKITGQELEQPDVPNLSGPKYDMLPDSYSIVEQLEEGTYTPDVQTSSAESPTGTGAVASDLDPAILAGAKKASEEAAAIAFNKTLSKAGEVPDPYKGGSTYDAVPYTPTKKKQEEKSVAEEAADSAVAAVPKKAEPRSVATQRASTKEAGRKARKDFEAYKNDPSNSKAIAENPAAVQRTESVIRDMERGIQRGFEKGGLASKKAKKKKSK